MAKSKKGSLPKYTLEEYQKYLDQPVWKKDSSEFKSESDYHLYWSRQIRAWRRQYQSQYKTIIAQWQEGVNYIETVPAKSFDVFVPDVAIAQERIPIALNAMMEQTALLYSNYPQPVYISPNEQQDQYAGALNQFAQVELKANAFNCQMLDLGIDCGVASLGVLKVYVDYDQKGPYNHDGKIIIRKIEPEKISFDPKAKQLKWEDMGFIIYTDTWDVSQARKMFEGGADNINESIEAPDDNRDVDNQYGTNLKSPVPNPIEGNSTNRNRVEIMECWFKDSRLKFVADIEAVNNSKFIDDPDKPGSNKYNPDYDEDKPEIYTRPALDEGGHVVGRMESAYPHGRCIIINGNKKVVNDFPNPNWHKKAPFVFFKGRPSRGLVTLGDLINIMKLDKKINDLYSRIHIMCQNEIERPMLAQTNTFKTPRSWFKMSGQPQAVIVKNPGTEFMRMPPTEIPQFPFVYLQELKQQLEKTMAVAGIMQGQLSEGSQLSAEAVSSIQGMATSVLKMKAELIAEGIKDLGYQLMWLIRETYPQNLTVNLQEPDGNKIQVNWNDDDAAEDYLVDIESSSGLPGQQDANINTILPLYREGLIDDVAALQALRKLVPDWKNVIQRKKADQLKKIEADAAGRALGLNIKKLESNKEKAGGTQKI